MRKLVKEAFFAKFSFGVPNDLYRILILNLGKLLILRLHVKPHQNQNNKRKYGRLDKDGDPKTFLSKIKN